MVNRFLASYGILPILQQITRAGSSPLRGIDRARKNFKELLLSSFVYSNLAYYIMEYIIYS